MADDCLFCRIVRGEIPAKLVHEDDRCVAFRDINAQAPTHVLVIPREHVASLNEATDVAMIGHLALVAARIAKQEGIPTYRAADRLAERRLRSVGMMVKTWPQWPNK